RRLQLISSGIFSYSHGTGDAQKTMGIIAVILYGTIWANREFQVPFWVVLLCHAAMGLGTAAGGWRIVRTMGHSLTKLQPIGGFCAETGGGVTILAIAKLGIPVSTTHTISGAHFNPAVTLADAAAGGIRWRETPLYLLAQVVGAFLGVAIAHLMFGAPLFTASRHARSGGAQFLGEVVATFGLLAVIWGV